MIIVVAENLCLMFIISSTDCWLPHFKALKTPKSATATTMVTLYSAVDDSARAHEFSASLKLQPPQEDIKKRQSTAFSNFILSEILDTRVDGRKWNLAFLQVIVALLRFASPQLMRQLMYGYGFRFVESEKGKQDVTCLYRVSKSSWNIGHTTFL